MRVLGIDIGFASLGWGVLQTRDFAIGEGAERAGEFVTCGVLETEKDSAVSKAHDSEARAVELTYAFEELVLKHGPFERLHIEGISWPRDAKATGKMGLAWGIVLSAAARYGWKITQIPPKTIKYRLTGSASASKKVVQAAVIQLLPASEKPLRALGYQREHAADALGAALWGEAYLAKMRWMQASPGMTDPPKL